MTAAEILRFKKIKPANKIGLALLFIFSIMGIIVYGLCLGFMFINGQLNLPFMVCYSNALISLFLVILYGAFGHRIEKFSFLRIIIFICGILHFVEAVLFISSDVTYLPYSIIYCVASFGMCYVGARLQHYEETCTVSTFLLLVFVGSYIAMMIQFRNYVYTSLIECIATHAFMVSHLFIWIIVYLTYLTTHYISPSFKSDRDFK